MAVSNTAFRTTTTLLGVTSTFLLGGMNMATSLLFIPHLVTLPTETSTRIFEKLFHDGAKAVIPLAATAILSLGYLAYETPVKRPELVAAAGLVGTTLAWTQLVVMPVNERLIEIARGEKEGRIGGGSKLGGGGRSEVESLLGTWECMNYVRGFVALGAGVLALNALRAGA
ncbi:unnamed protein product [Discula destructiva]